VNISSKVDTSDEISINYPRIDTILLLLFCGYVFIWYLQIGYRMPFLGAIRFEFIYAAILTVLAILFTPKLNLKSPVVPYVLLYFLVIVIQLPFSYDFETSWNVFVDRIIKFAFMFFFIASFVRSPTHMKYFLAAFLLACLKMGQEGLIGRITGNLIWENQGVMRLHGSTPLYDHPNSFSGMALGTLPFVYYLWPYAKKYVRLILLVIAILSLNIIIYTASRTGYVGFSVFILCIFITSRNKKKFLLILLLIFIMTIPLIPADYMERFDSIFTLQDKEGHSTEKRMVILEDSWEIFKEHPLGVGVAAFPKVRMDRFGRNQDTHNLYLEIATNLGFQGFIVVSLFIYKMLATLNNIRASAQMNIIKLLNNGNQRNDILINDLNFVKSLSLATISFIIIRLTLGLFGMDLYEIYWWFAVGISFSLYSIMDNLQKAINDHNTV